VKGQDILVILTYAWRLVPEELVVHQQHQLSTIQVDIYVY
jgi:hypothetical protein